jgi:hypothetical protein
MSELPPVDLVYTWVDGSNPLFAAKVEKYRREESVRMGKAPTPYGTGAQRFRDLDNLRYSLRSVEQNAPWFRRVIIVTNGQVPRWLRKESSAEIVRHEEIFERLDALPTFNACAIETQLHRIPDLGRYFVFMNDDFFFSRPTAKEYFFGANGRPKLMLSPHPIEPRFSTGNRWEKTLFSVAEKLSKRFGSRLWVQGAHGPACFDRELLEKIYSLWPAEMERASRNRFRDESDMQLHALYMNAAAALDEEEQKGESDRYERMIMPETELRIVSVGEPGKGWRGNLLEVVANPPQLLCLNDTGPNEPTPGQLAEIAEIEKAHMAFLEKMFPKPSSFERV